MDNALHAFWTTPQNWPVEMAGFVFLARAVDRIGKARFPASWKISDAWLREAPAPLPVEPAGTGLADATVLRRAYELLGRPVQWTEGEAPNAVARLSGSVRYITPLDPTDWAEARLKSVEVVIERQKSRARWNDVLSCAEELFRRGILVAHTRPTKGASETDTGYDDALPVRVWNTEATRIRFAKCQIDWDRQFDQQTPAATGRRPSVAGYDRGEDFRYIFVTESTLLKSIGLLGTLPPPPAEIAEHSVRTDDAGNVGGLTLAHRKDFIAAVQAEVRAHLDGPAHGRDRSYFIGVGRQRFRLPKDAAEKAWTEALGGVDGHKWSRVGRRPKP